MAKYETAQPAAKGSLLIAIVRRVNRIVGSQMGKSSKLFQHEVAEREGFNRVHFRKKYAILAK